MLTTDTMWAMVARRDRAGDGVFVYAVRSTGIYCRPSCPARRPRSREAVEFFPGPDAAERAGYRACLRCRPDANADDWQRDLGRIQRACRLIERRAEERGGEPALEELAREAGDISPSTLQKTFRRILGVSPKEYAGAVRARRFRAMLREGERIGVAACRAGYSSPGMLYGAAGPDLGIPPATYRAGGQGAEIGFTVVPCPLGRMLVAATARGVCSIQLGDSEEELEEALRREFPHARITAGDPGTVPFLLAALSALGADREASRAAERLPLDVRATSFQRRVWRALREIPPGETRSYGQIAAALGAAGAARAVGSACAANPVALAIPCHRAVRSDGGLSRYRWGAGRKKVLIEHEGTRESGDASELPSRRR